VVTCKWRRADESGIVGRRPKFGHQTASERGRGKKEKKKKKKAIGARLCRGANLKTGGPDAKVRALVDSLCPVGGEEVKRMGKAPSSDQRVFGGGV